MNIRNLKFLWFLISGDIFLFEKKTRRRYFCILLQGTRDLLNASEVQGRSICVLTKPFPPRVADVILRFVFQSPKEIITNALRTKVSSIELHWERLYGSVWRRTDKPDLRYIGPPKIFSFIKRSERIRRIFSLRSWWNLLRLASKQK